MFRDKVSGVYDLAETVYNGKVYRKLGEKLPGRSNEMIPHWKDPYAALGEVNC